MKLQFIFFSIKGVLLTLGVCFQHCFYTFETMKKLLLLLFIPIVCFGQNQLDVGFNFQTLKEAMEYFDKNGACTRGFFRPRPQSKSMLFLNKILIHAF